MAGIHGTMQQGKCHSHAFKWALLQTLILHSVRQGLFWHVSVLTSAHLLSCPLGLSEKPFVPPWGKLYPSKQQWHKTRRKQWAQPRLRFSVSQGSMTIDCSELETIYRLNCSRSEHSVLHKQTQSHSEALRAKECPLIHPKSPMNSTHKSSPEIEPKNTERFSDTVSSRVQLCWATCAFHTEPSCI